MKTIPAKNTLLTIAVLVTIVNVTLLVLVPVLRQGMNLVMMMGHMLVKLRGIIQTRKFRLTNSA